MKTVTLISSDGEEFKVPINVAEQSKRIKNILDHVGDSGKIPVSNVNSVTLAKVMEYCKKHADHEAAAADDDVGAANNAGVAAEELKEWDVEFLKTERFDFLFNIILAANYMDIKSLLDSAFQTMADMIKNNSLEEIHQILNIKNNFTPEEEEQVRKENKK